MDWYFNRQGQPVSQEEWVANFALDRRVAVTDLGKLGRVSTVFLGMNHAYGGGPPLIFETMIFDGPMDQYMDRYSTEDEALDGHGFAVLALMFYKPVGARPALIHNGRKPRRGTVSR